MKHLIALTLFAVLLSCSSGQQQIERYSIEDFYENTRVSGGIFSPDESRLLVSSDESGIFNVYEIDIETTEKKQLTHSTVESFFARGYVPETGQVIYTADKGGDEITHIFLLHDDGTSTDLTPGEEENASFAGWSEDDQYMYYASNKRDSRYFDIYKMDTGNWEAEMLYQNDDGLNFAGMSDDENIFALQRSITTSQNKLYLYNRLTDEMLEISSDEKPGSYSASGFSSDSKSFFYITNADKEFSYLVRYDMETGLHEPVYETNWDVMYSYLSENETYRIIGINEDGKTTLVVKDNDTWEDIEFPDIADGNIIGVRISESEDKMRLTVGTSKAPANLYVYNFESGDLKKLTDVLNPEINPEHLVSAEVVRYESFDGLEIPAIYYKPLTSSNNNKVPALAWVHGGPGGQSRVGYFSLIQYLVNHGYAVLAVNNRGSSGYGKTFYKMDDRNHGEGDLKDCIWGKKWLAQQDYIDAEKIGIIGGSYGGYMTMAAMTFTPEEFEVGVNIFGVTNWLRTLRSIPPWWEANRNALYEELGDPNTADSVRLYEISPLFHAHKVQNPVMVLQGANDPRVLQVESDEIVEALRANDVPVEYVLFEDEGHGFRKKENEIEGYGQILTFLDKYLKGEEEEETASK
jgi:dipeptidyl aminopeptidase/acylaminoacyl peptidase